jgi:hypothetical protein
MTNIQERVAYGINARIPAEWARLRFCAWLEGKLNDTAGPYFEALRLKLTPPDERRAIVTDNRKIARAMYSRATSPPVVMVSSLPSDDWMLSGQKIEGVFHHGKRHELSFDIDMGINDATPGQVDVVSEERDDALLAAFVADAVREGYDELAQIGLNHAVMVPTNNAGNGRHPHRMTFFVITLDDWAPSTP